MYYESRLISFQLDYQVDGNDIQDGVTACPLSHRGCRWVGTDSEYQQTHKVRCNFIDIKCLCSYEVQKLNLRNHLLMHCPLKMHCRDGTDFALVKLPLGLESNVGPEYWPSIRPVQLNMKDEAQDDEAQDDEAQDDEAQDDEAQDDEAQDDEAQDDEAQDDEAQDDEAQDDEAQDDEAQDDEAQDDEAQDEAMEID
ncbi:hypothetical protein QZH41_002036 [Actinostola sp. cb2023]|nr:hypothetical protein QZH41_002036 [Actinostola sp. cb2023]